jgi:endonuclease III
VVSSSLRQRRLPCLLDRLEADSGPADPPPSTDGWHLVLAESIGYLVSDDRRWQAVAKLERVVGLDPGQILAAPDEVLRTVVIGARPDERVMRIRRCAELMIGEAPWTAFPGIGRPGAERIDLFTGARPVLALDANGLRVLTRLGYAVPGRSYDVCYRQAQTAAAAELAATQSTVLRAHLLLRRHGQSTCRRKDPACSSCPIASACPSAGHPPALY